MAYWRNDDQLIQWQQLQSEQYTDMHITHTNYTHYAKLCKNWKNDSKTVKSDNCDMTHFADDLSGNHWYQKKNKLQQLGRNSKQESCLKFADINYKFKSNQAAKTRLPSYRNTAAKYNLT